MRGLDSISKQSAPGNAIAATLKKSRFALVNVGVLSFFANLLMLAGPLFMLQVYDRVLTSRSLPTLTVLVALVYPCT